MPDSAEGSLGVYLYDFLYELEESDNIKREAQKISVETQGPTGQPGSKKMRMDEPQVKFGSEKQVNTPSIKKFGVGAVMCSPFIGSL